MSFFSVKDVTKSFFGNTAVDHVSIEVEQGEIVGLIGANGAGKTTFFNCLTGYYKADSGEITFRGTPIGRLPAYRICRLGIARTFQNIRLFTKLTARDNVKVGLTNAYPYSLVSGIFRLPSYYRSEKAMNERAGELLFQLLSVLAVHRYKH